MVVNNSGHPGTEGVLRIRIDGSQRLSANLVAALGAVCDQAEDQGGPGIVLVQVSGAPPAAPGHRT